MLIQVFVSISPSVYLYIYTYSISVYLHTHTHRGGRDEVIITAVERWRWVINIAERREVMRPGSGDVVVNYCPPYLVHVHAHAHTSTDAYLYSTDEEETSGNQTLVKGRRSNIQNNGHDQVVKWPNTLIPLKWQLRNKIKKKEDVETTCTRTESPLSVARPTHVTRTEPQDPDTLRSPRTPNTCSGLGTFRLDPVSKRVLLRFAADRTQLSVHRVDVVL